MPGCYGKANFVPHFWQGKPGLWKKLLTAEAARRIAAAQPRSFEQLCYRCDPDPGLTREQADANWDTLAGTMLPPKRRSAFGSETVRRSMSSGDAKFQGHRTEWNSITSLWERRSDRGAGFVLGVRLQAQARSPDSV